MILAARGGSNYNSAAGLGYLQDSYGPFLSPTSFGDDAYSPVGLVAVAAAVRLVAGTIGSFVMRVYEGDAEHRQPRLDAPQAAILQDGAEGYATSMDLWRDVVTSVELTGNAFIWKGRVKSGRVGELYAFPTDAVRVFVSDRGDKVVEAKINGEVRDITSDVIHVRGWSPVVAVSGASTPQLHRRSLRGAWGMEEFRGRYFDNDSSVNLVISTPNNLTVEQRTQLRESWKSRHAGSKGEKTAFLWGGLTAQQLSSTLAESQVAELSDKDAAQIALMFGIYPRELIVSDLSAGLPDAENLSILFMRFTLLHRMRTIERAVSADRDLFPDRAVYSRFDVTEFVRGDTATTAAKLHSLRQVGAITANEARAEIGLPPSTDPAADELQATPVGGAPNPAGAAS